MSKIPEEMKSWHPDRPTSKGSTAYHDAVSNAVYYLENLDELARMIKEKIKANDIVVDFGAGTGVSALCLLKKLQVPFKLYLVDNSPAWLGKAHEIFDGNENVRCFLLDKINARYATLAETIGHSVADHVLSANTVHLIPDLEECFAGISLALKKGGSFTFQSGNIARASRKEGVLMVDDTIKRVHDIAMEIVRTDASYSKYKSDLDRNIELEREQRKFVFPEPRGEEAYLNALRNSGFKEIESHYKLIRIGYDDWLDFLRVKRLQAGILPEIGGKDPSQEEERDRDCIITAASKKLFKELETQNPMADGKSFTVEWVYVSSVK